MNQLSDISLVAQTVLGSNRAFEQLVLRHQSPIRRFFLQHTNGDEMTSDDLAQETFIKAYTRIGSFKSLSSFSSWLYRIAYNVFYDYTRSRKPTEGVDRAEVGQYSATNADSDKAMDIERAMQQLSGEIRTAVILYYMEDMRVNDVAEVMNCPTGTVKSYLSKGREQLSHYLKDAGYGTGN